MSQQHYETVEREAEWEDDENTPASDDEMRDALAAWNEHNYTKESDKVLPTHKRSNAYELLTDMEPL